MQANFPNNFMLILQLRITILFKKEASKENREITKNLTVFFLNKQISWFFPNSRNTGLECKDLWHENQWGEKNINFNHHYFLYKRYKKQVETLRDDRSFTLEV